MVSQSSESHQQRRGRSKLERRPAVSPQPSRAPWDGKIAPAADAATVILVRDRLTAGGAGGLEVYLVQRHEELEVAGGRFVFPGGKVDKADRDPFLTSRCDGLGEADAAAAFGAQPGETPGLGLWVAAIRELFEEAGILLAYDAGGAFVESHAPRYQEYAALLRQHVLSFRDLVGRADLTLAARRLHSFAHWITPVWVPRRFSARFFVAVLPPGQEPRHDQGEAVDGAWMTPHEALAKIGDGSMLAMLATQRNLQHVGQSRSVAELLAATEQRRIAAITPRRLEVDGVRRFVIPGEPGYEEGE